MMPITDAPIKFFICSFFDNRKFYNIVLTEKELLTERSRNVISNILMVMITMIQPFQLSHLHNSNSFNFRLVYYSLWFETF